MSTIAKQREQIAALQNQVQSGELENKRLTDEIAFLRQKQSLTSADSNSGKRTAHEEAKKSPKVPAIPQEENKKGPQLRGDKKPVQEAAPKVIPPAEKKAAAPAAKKKQDVAPKTKNADQASKSSPPREKKNASPTKAQEKSKMETKATSSQEENKKVKAPKSNDKKPAPSEDVQELDLAPKPAQKKEEKKSPAPVEPVKATKVPQMKSAKPATKSPSKTPESSTTPTETSPAKEAEKPKKSSPPKQVEETKEIVTEIAEPQPSTQGGSIFTRMPANLFRYEVLPCLAHPRQVAVLRCLDREHSSMINDRSEGIVSYFEGVLEEISNEVSEEKTQEFEKALTEAMQAIRNLDIRAVKELKAFCSPPPVAEGVCNIVVMLLTGNLKPDWAAFKKLAANAAFIQLMINFDINSVAKRTINACRKAFRNLNTDHARVRNVSMACAGFFLWIQALVDVYYSPDVQQGLKIKAQKESFNRALDPLRADQNSAKEEKKTSPGPKSSAQEEKKISPQLKKSAKEPKKSSPEPQKSVEEEKKNSLQPKKSPREPKQPSLAPKK